jgi:hypothetical protein
MSYSSIRGKRPRLVKPVLYVVEALVLIGIIVGAVLFFHSKQPIIPPKIAKQISFRIYWPNSANATAEKSTIKYDSQQSVLSYKAKINSVETTVTEQGTPSQFSDVQNYFSTFINHLNNYDTFDSANGTVYLTMPSNTSGETGIVNHSGTLLFAHAEGKLSESDWRLFFNNLRVVEN